MGHEADKGANERRAQKTLRDVARDASAPRFRQRAHCVYLCEKGYRVNRLMDIFVVDRNTVSDWLTAWERKGLMSLGDNEHPERPRRITKEELMDESGFSLNGCAPYSPELNIIEIL